MITNPPTLQIYNNNNNNLKKNLDQYFSMVLMPHILDHKLILWLFDHNFNLWQIMSLNIYEQMYIKYHTILYYF
jgi:hypothetical protein